MYKSALIKNISRIFSVICGILPLIVFIIMWMGILNTKIYKITGVIPVIGILYLSIIAIVVGFLSKKILPRKLNKALIIINIILTILNLIPLLYLRLGPYLLGP